MEKDWQLTSRLETIRDLTIMLILYGEIKKQSASEYVTL